MRRSVTWIVLGAVGLLAALAAADALRPDAGSKPAAAPPTTTRAKAPTLRETLRAEAVSGLVLYSDRDCRLHSLLLPRMIDDVVRDDGGADVFHCRFSVPVGHIVGGDVVAQPSGREVARCRGDHVAVWNLESGTALRSIRGCHPAWQPDGTLTYERGGAIYADRRPLLTRADLRSAARRHPNLADYDPTIPLDVRVSDLAWLDHTHVVVAMEISARYLEPQFLAVVFQGKGVATVAASFRGPYEHLFVSPDGLLAGAADGTVFTRSGRAIDPPQKLPPGRAVAFTPDDRWLVWLTGSSIFLVEPSGDEGSARTIRLPIPARDLVWEPITSGTSVGPPRNR